MEIRNRIADVESMRCHVCQEFLALIAQPGWQQRLYEKAKKEYNKRSDKYYRDIYKLFLRYENPSAFRAEDVDVTGINTIILYSGCTGYSLDAKTENAFKILVIDRNRDHHSHRNEEDSLLYIRALVALYDLHSFVDCVTLEEYRIEESKRRAFSLKWIKAIENLIDILDDERFELVGAERQVRKDVEEILRSGDAEERFLSKNEIYLKKITESTKDASDDGDTPARNIYRKFLQRSADAGVITAMRLLVSTEDPFRDGTDGFPRLAGYMSSIIRSRHYDSLDVLSMVTRINHRISDGKRDEKAKEIIALLRQQGYDIKASQNGGYIYSLLKNKG